MIGKPARMVTRTDAPPRPKLAFRVGVTGVRNLGELPSPTQETIRRQVHDVLAVVRDEIMRIAASEGAHAVYETTGETMAPRLRVISPLAEGADRLVAEVATDLGFELDVALPFDRTNYAVDFEGPGSREAFDGWLDGPPVRNYLELDGPTGRENKNDRVVAEDNLAYEAVGRFVVRNCDVLVAIWAGETAKGRGGTAEIARFCARSGRPVWWIDANGIALPRLVTATTRLRWQEAAVAGEAARAALAILIVEMLAPPSAHRTGHPPDPARTDGHGHNHGVIVGAIRGLHHLGQRLPETVRVRLDCWFGPGGDPLLTYLEERERRERRPWRLYSWFYRRLAGSSSLPDREIAVPEGPASYWKAYYEPADRASKGYGNRYRSSYVWIFVLATAAVICAVLSLGYKGLKPWATPAELAFLLGILGLVVVNVQRRWHGRWIAYRLLAELCRKQAALAVLGWSLPPPDLRRLSGEAAPEAWVGHYFSAAARAAPLPTGAFRGEQLERAHRYVLEALIDDQRDYHEDRRARTRTAGRRLVDAGGILFFLTLALVAAKLLLIRFAPETHDACAPCDHGLDFWHGAIVLFGVSAAILPALSAASVGVRAYAELELLESQSARMEDVMKKARKRVVSLDLDRTLASQDLAAEVFDVATEMLREVEGWADLFRVKVVETG